ncbi:MAG: hypothetical protein LC733_04290 [Actinobacteria bacterium]|nr:hypothetical protein [Actinomycetota bacterium]
MRRFLVVANQTLASERLAEKLRQCLAAGPCSFHVLVPATHSRHQLVWSEGADRAIAQRRLTEALERLRAQGVEADGEVGDERPVDAIADVLNRGPVDEIIVVTLPPGISRWLRQDLPHRARRVFDGPVTHVVAEAPSLSQAV